MDRGTAVGGPRARKVSLAIATLALLGACASTQPVWLIPNQAIPAEPNGGGLPVAVAPEAEGVPDPIGHSTVTVFAVRSGDVVLQEGPARIMQAVGEALRAADFRAVPARDRPEGPVLRCEVLQLAFQNYTWFAPFTLLWGDVALRLSLAEADGRVVWERDYRSAFTGRGTNQPFHRGVNVAFGKLMTRVAEDFTRPEFREACCPSPSPSPPP